MSVCIFPGRFQPFHTGQLMVIKGMIKSCDKVIIAICSGDYREDDLFSVDNVREMISSALLSDDIVDANIVEIKDSEEDENWVDEILELAGGNSVKIWTGDEKVKELFEKRSEVEIQNISLVPGFNGKEIKEMIESGNNSWREKVPAGAMDIVYEKFFKEN